MPHVATARIALTGGMAIGLRLNGDADGPRRGIAAADIDFVAEDVEAVRPSVATDFLISHFHLPQSGYPKFMIQLADPVTRVRIDFFPDSLRAVVRAASVTVGGVQLRVLHIDDLLAHKLALLSKASPTAPIDEKHFQDAERLASLRGRAVGSIPSSHLADTVLSRDLEELCPRCQVSRCDAFPLASKRAVFAALGYV